MNRIITVVATLCLLGAIFSCQKSPSLILIGPKSLLFNEYGGSQSVVFSSNRDWKITSSDSWCKASPSSGTANDGQITVSIVCDNNKTYNTRSATLIISVGSLSEMVLVTQEDNKGFIVSPLLFELNNTAQTIDIEVQRNVNYIIDIDASCRDWIQKVGTKALSSEVVSFSIEANETYDNREGSISFLQADGQYSQTVTIKQSQTDYLSIPTNKFFLSGEYQTLNIELTSNVDFLVSSNVDWLSHVETKGLGEKSVIISVDENVSSANRSGIITINEIGGSLSQKITVYQVSSSNEGIDLGLSVKWANFNLGASRLEELGSSFRWGETDLDYGVYDKYKWFTQSVIPSVIKYNTNSENGPVDNLIRLEDTDDAAHVALGGGWRIPTKEEWDELRNGCVAEFVIINERYEILVKSKTTGQFLFLPGCWGAEYYWTSDLCQENPLKAWDFAFALPPDDIHNENIEGIGRIWMNYRNHSHRIRPVIE